VRSSKSRFLILTAVLAMVLTGCASTGASGSTPSKGPSGTVTFALPTGVIPTDIFPFMSGPISNNVSLFQFTNLSWRPLYWFGTGSSPTINYSESLAGPPTYSNGGRTVTVTLNHKYFWSTGKPVTNRDVEFWMNILDAERQNWVGYSTGSIPDNITAMSFPAGNPYQFSLTFNKVYSHLYLLYDQLSQIVPIPQQAWDKTSISGAIGNFDMTTAGAKAVYNFLNGQASTESTYGTNPLWKTVDGPWVLSQFSPSTGATTFVPNLHYTGPSKPTIAHFEEVPFTSTTAEFDALRSGQLDYGYLPPEDYSQAGYFKSRGYQVSTWYDYGFNNILLNYSNTSAGPLLKQLYIRQAMQDLINQPQINRDIYHGLSFSTYSPIPIVPESSYLDAALKRNPYPYSVANAKALLSSHGWQVTPNGTDICHDSGTGSGQCGAGIRAGTALSFVEEAVTGSAPFLAEIEEMQSSWSLAGIHVSIDLHSEGEVYSTLEPCSDGNAGCQWQIANIGMFGSTATYSPEYLPDAAMWFAAGGANNVNGFSNDEVNQLSNAVETTTSLAAIQKLAEVTGQVLPGLWEPNYPYQISVVSPHLTGALPQNPNLDITPEFWRLTS